jgi:branched-chain amino acid transport system permease protein
MYSKLIFGLAMILMMIFRPGGIWPRKRGGIEKVPSHPVKSGKKSIKDAV